MSSDGDFYSAMWLTLRLLISTFHNLIQKPRSVSSYNIWICCPLKLLLNKSSWFGEE